MKILRYMAWLVGLAALVGLVLGTRFVLIAAPGGAGLAAKQLCSLVYVSGLDPERAQSLYIDEAVSPLSLALAAEYDNAQRRVTATGFGLWSATAEARDSLGCTLIAGLDDGESLPTADLPEVRDKPLRRATHEDTARSFDLSAVDLALDQAFSPEHDTMAVVVLHGGELVAERYASGIDSATPLPGWSMAKSVTATLVGLLVKRGQLDVNQPGIVPEWRDHKDGGEKVTLDHLLRMTSGLDVVEDQSGADPKNTQMLFTEPDSAAYAARRGLKAAPGTHWEYMSGSTVLVSRAVVDATGGTLESSQAFLREELLKPLGAASLVMEPDAAGTFIGSSFVLASAHDWAKLGQLYLNDCVWEGERLLPDGWRDYVTRNTPESGTNSYGAGFWTLEQKDIEGLPRDTFYANGFQGQWVIVIPSRSLVVVRLGASHGPTGTWPFVADLVSAMNELD